MRVNFLLSETHPRLLGRQQVGEHVVARIAAALVESGLQEARDLARGGERAVGIGRMAQHRARPQALLLLGPDREAELAANRPERHHVGEVRDQIAFTTVDETAHDFVRERGEIGLDEAVDGARAEGRHRELPVAVVLVAVHVDESVADHRLNLELVGRPAREPFVVHEKLAEVGESDHDEGGQPKEAGLREATGAARLRQELVKPPLRQRVTAEIDIEFELAHRATVSKSKRPGGRRAGQDGRAGVTGSPVFFDR